MDGDGEATEGVPLDDRLRLQGSQPSGGKRQLHRGMDQWHVQARVLLLRQQKLPCFVVHEFPPETLVPLSTVPNLPTFYNFVDGMDTVYLVLHNTYQLLAEELGRLDSLFHQEDR
jgi:hypothetical protein